MQSMTHEANSDDTHALHISHATPIHASVPPVLRAGTRVPSRFSHIPATALYGHTLIFDVPVVYPEGSGGSAAVAETAPVTGRQRGRSGNGSGNGSGDGQYIIGTILLQGSQRLVHGPPSFRAGRSLR